MPVETILTRLLIATVLGGIIGAEREYRDKSAGFRTLMLISTGACLFTIISIIIGDSHSSDDRIASNIVTGIGFVGAGVIFKDANHVNGITTAATIWITAAIGMAMGAGDYYSAIVTCAITLVVLIIFHIIEQKMDDMGKLHHYSISAHYEPGVCEEMEELFKTYKLSSKRKKIERKNNIVTGEWVLHGHKRQHQKLMRELLDNKKIYELNFYQ